MKALLNITNGDSASEIMRLAQIPGDYLPWRDVLHEGPVPGGLSLDELSDVRARFIASCGWGEFPAIRADFHQRNTCLANAAYDKIVLWFEHDLYDQLQILQILDWLHHYAPRKISISLICTNRYLGMLSPAEMRKMIAHEQPVTAEQLSLASRAWTAFRSNTPYPWLELLDQDTRALPFLRAAVLRQLQDYPACGSGLSRTAGQALKLVDSGIGQAGKLFAANQQQEEAIFMGDASFFLIIEQMINAPTPLLRINEGQAMSLPVDPAQILSLTEAGRAVLRGESNWLPLSQPKRWIGGVHLRPGDYWCWDEQQQRVHKVSH